MNIPIKSYDDLHRIFIEEEKLSEEEFREGFYNANPNLKYPDERVERTIQKLYHPSLSDLEDEIKSRL